MPANPPQIQTDTRKCPLYMGLSVVDGACPTEIIRVQYVRAVALASTGTTQFSDRSRR